MQAEDNKLRRKQRPSIPLQPSKNSHTLREDHSRMMTLNAVIFAVAALHTALVSSAPLYVREARNGTNNQNCSYFPQVWSSCCNIQQNMMTEMTTNAKIDDTKTSNNDTDNLVTKDTMANGTTTDDKMTDMATTNDTTTNNAMNMTIPSGVYNLDHYGPFSATYGYCDMETDGGGWLVIFRREGEFDFQKGIQEYEDGFGELKEGKSFWYGLKALNHITNRDIWELRVDLINDDEQLHAHYASILIGDTSEGYILQLGPHVADKSTTSDNLRQFSGMMFITEDNDGDSDGDIRCPQTGGGGWWYLSNCGGHGILTAAHPHLQGWYDEDEGTINSYTRTEMKIRQRSCNL